MMYRVSGTTPRYAAVDTDDTSRHPTRAFCAEVSCLLFFSESSILSLINHNARI